MNSARFERRPAIGSETGRDQRRRRARAVNVAAMQRDSIAEPSCDATEFVLFRPPSRSARIGQFCCISTKFVSRFDPPLLESPGIRTIRRAGPRWPVVFKRPVVSQCCSVCQFDCFATSFGQSRWQAAHIQRVQTSTCCPTSGTDRVEPVHRSAHGVEPGPGAGSPSGPSASTEAAEPASPVVRSTLNPSRTTAGLPGRRARRSRPSRGRRVSRIARAAARPLGVDPVPCVESGAVSWTTAAGRPADAMDEAPDAALFLSLEELRCGVCAGRLSGTV